MRPLNDISPSEWLTSALVEPGHPWTAGDLVPESFEALVRVLLPQYRVGEHSFVDWAGMAEAVGIPYGPDIRWSDLEARRTDDHPWDEGTPTGQIQERERGILGLVLAPFTTTPGDCYFAVWEGYGGIAEMPETLAEIAGRRYLVFQGTVDDMAGFAVGHPILWASFNLAWPGDRAWLINADLDLHSAYIGCSNVCASAIVASHLEAHLVDRTQPLEPE